MTSLVDGALAHCKDTQSVDEFVHRFISKETDNGPSGKMRTDSYDNLSESSFHPINSSHHPFSNDLLAVIEPEHASK